MTNDHRGARYYDLAHGNPISHTHIERDFGGGSEGRSPSVRRLRRWPEPHERRRERAALRSAESSMKSLLDAMDSEDELSRSLRESEERLDGLRWQLKTSPESSRREVRG